MIPAPSLGFGDGDAASRRTVAFDYAFRFELTGTPGTRTKSTVRVSTEADFVAVSVGYGVVPKVTPIVFGPDVSARPTTSRRQTLFSAITFAEVVAGLATSLPATSRSLKGALGAQIALASGVKLNPAFVEQALVHVQHGTPLPPNIFKDLFQVVGAPPEQIEFLYALFDDGSGREFQSEPILNTAGLGAADGDRPFRYFPRPITFTRQSTIRMEITELSDFEGELHVALQGYKVLGAAGTPTAPATHVARRSRR
jgi:hypothetical protein